jgi:hypothetical protein
MIILRNTAAREAMTRAQVAATTELEGRIVNVALVGGRRYDDCQLVSVPRRRAKTFWVFSSGEEVFAPADPCWRLGGGRTILTAR